MVSFGGLVGFEFELRSGSSIRSTKRQKSVECKSCSVN